MKTLYIFDDYQLSSTCGVGTYLSGLLKCLSRWNDMHVCMIMFNTHAEECCLYTHEGTDYILFPQTLGIKPFEEGEAVCSLLEEYIPNEKDTYFLFNYTPCESLMQGVRKFFPLSMQICVVHDLNFTAPCLGDVDFFRELISREEKQIPSSYKEVVRLYRREKIQFQEADRVICLSEDTYTILQECYCLSKEKVVLIPHGIERKEEQWTETVRTKWRHLYHLADNEKIILTVGRTGKAKGIFAFLNAYRSILKSEPDCRWIIAGGLSNTSELLASMGEMVTKITFTGRLDKEELSRWYRMADVGVLPSYSEQCSYVGLEMMNEGLPIIASDGLGVRCMFQDGLNACVAKIETRQDFKPFAKKLADCTLRLLHSPALQKELKNNAFRILKNRYGFWEMEKHYRTVFYGFRD